MANEFDEAFAGMVKRARDMRPATKEIAKDLADAVAAKFESGDPSWDLKADGAKSTLTENGDLRDSLRRKATATTSQVFTESPVARFHLTGDGVPVRDFMDVLTPAAIDSAAEKLNRHVIGED